MSGGAVTLKGMEAFASTPDRPGLRWGGPGLSRLWGQFVSYFALTLIHGPGWVADGFIVVGDPLGGGLVPA